MNAAEYFDGILKQAGVAEAKRQALVGSLSDEEISKALANEHVAPKLRQDEFSRKMDELSTKEKAVLADKQAYYQKSLSEYQAYEQKRKEYEGKLAELGGVDPDPKPATIHSVQDVVTKKDLEELLSKRDGNVLTIIKGAMRYSADYMHRFGEPLDPEALEKVAVEKNLPLNLAYDELIKPKVEAKAKADQEAAIAAARDEGARDALAKHKLPVDTKPREFHPIFDRDAAKVAAAGPNRERALRDGFVEEWNKAGATSAT